MAQSKNVLLICILNSGFSDEVMETLREKGAKGGTVFDASSSVAKDADKLFGVVIHPEKEIILILTTNKLSNDMLNVIYDKYGPNSEARSIAFTLPVSNVSSNILEQLK